MLPREARSPQEPARYARMIRCVRAPPFAKKATARWAYDGRMSMTGKAESHAARLCRLAILVLIALVSRLLPARCVLDA